MGRQYSAEKAIAEARSYVGCKWRHRGRSRFGIDCIGLLVASMAAGGVEMRDRRDYGRTPWMDGLEQEMRDHFGDPIPLADAQPGDVVLMRWDDRSEPSHVGILADSRHARLALIHSYSLTQVIEHDLDTVWSDRIVMVFRP